MTTKNACKNQSDADNDKVYRQYLLELPNYVPIYTRLMMIQQKNVMHIVTYKTARNVYNNAERASRT